MLCICSGYGPLSAFPLPKCASATRRLSARPGRASDADGIVAGFDLKNMTKLLLSETGSDATTSSRAPQNHRWHQCHRGHCQKCQPGRPVEDCRYAGIPQAGRIEFALKKDLQELNAGRPKIGQE